MKKLFPIFAALVFFLLVVPAVAMSISPDAAGFVTTIYIVAIIALPFVLGYLLVKHFRGRTKKMAERPVQASQAEQPMRQRTVAATDVDRVPEFEHIRDEDHAEGMAANGIAYYYKNVGIFVPYLDVLERPDVVPGAVVTFRQEPENRFDKRAVAVVIGRKRIGYLYRGRLQDMANDWLGRGDTVSGRIVRVSSEAYNAKGNSIAIDLYFYE